MNHNVFIAYFSRAGNNYMGGHIVNLTVGNTEVAAKMCAEITGGRLFPLEPLKKYSENYETCTKEAKAELSADARPALTAYPDDLEGYDTVLLCYPNYWGTLPMPVWTFLEKFDFSGKTVLPLCTHEGSGMGRSESDLRKLCPGAEMKKGLAIRGTDVKNAKNQIAAWLKNANL